MDNGNPAKFICSACGRKYTWKLELAGRRAKCKCGTIIQVPLDPPVVKNDCIPFSVREEPLHQMQPSAIGQNQTGSLQSQTMQSQVNSSSIDWEVMLSTGERLLLNEKDAVPLLRHHLLMGKAKLRNRCRLHKPVTETADSEGKYQQRKTPTQWKTLREYADDKFSLCVLYDPSKAWANRGAIISRAVMIVPVATVCNAFWLVGLGEEMSQAISGGLVLSFSTLTLIPLPFVVFAFQSAYHTNPVLILMLDIISLIVSAFVSYVIGYTIGGVLGLTRPKLLE